MTRSSQNCWLHRFALLTAMATLVLIGIGGLVTSHGVGMSVPDWPTTYGYNMFFFPFSKWVGGVFYEHSHRLVASAVGFLTTILAVWLWLKEERAWLRWLGVVAWFGVVLQGVLGGLRVRWMQDELGVFHAALAQLFFVLIGLIALFTSKGWPERAHPGVFGRDSGPRPLLPLPVGRGEGWGEGKPRGVDEPPHPGPLLQPMEERERTLTTSGYTGDRLATNLPVYDPPGLRYLYAFATVIIFLQLIVGATMRHQHAGLAIPDFPLAYGKFWPSADAEAVARYNHGRSEATALHPITTFQVELQMVHRIGAVLVLSAVSWAALRTLRVLGRAASLTRLSQVWLGLILSQVGLGIVTIWTNKSADIATAHVVVGALSLWMGSLLTLLAFGGSRWVLAPVTAGPPAPGIGGAPRPVRSLT